MDTPTVVVACLAAASVFPLIRIWAARTDRGRSYVRKVYTGAISVGRVPQIVSRNAMSVGPFWSLMFAVAGVSVLVPRVAGAWLLGACVCLFGIGWAVAYRDPPPFLPGWLKAEIESGEIPPAQTDRWDWLMFWLIVPMTILGAVSLVALVVVYHEAG